MVIIDPEFKKLIDPLTEQEREDLENNLIENGFNEAFPIIIWKGYNIIVDGHNRFELSNKLGLEPKFIEQEFESREAVKAWMINAQLARRNLTKEQLSYYRGMEYNLEKAGHGGARRKNCDLKTDVRLAEKHHVSPRTIQTDGKFKEIVTKICDVCEMSKNDLLLKFKKSDILTLADVPEDKIKKALENLEKGSKTKKIVKDEFIYRLNFDADINKMLVKMSHGDEQSFIEGLIKSEYERRQA